MTPDMRKALGLLLLLGGGAVYCLLAATGLALLNRPPLVLEVLLYALVGTVWIVAAKPVMLWMQTGQWRAPKKKDAA